MLASKIGAAESLTLAILMLVGICGSGCLADNAGERCVNTSTSCYDTASHTARTCTTTTCTYADGHTTTSVSVTIKKPPKGSGGVTKPTGVKAAPIVTGAPNKEKSK
jgi:hypothetical protein